MDIESEGLQAWLGKLMQELRQKSYKADPLKRVWLDKPDGSQRPIAIPVATLLGYIDATLSMNFN